MREISVSLAAITYYNKTLFEQHEIPQSLKSLMWYSEDQEECFTIAETQTVYFNESDEDAIKKYILNAGLTLIQHLKIQDPEIKIVDVDENVLTTPILLLPEELQELQGYEKYMYDLNEEIEVVIDTRTCTAYEVITENLPNAILINHFLGYEEDGVVHERKDYYEQPIIVQNNFAQFKKGIEEYESINGISIKDA